MRWFSSSTIVPLSFNLWLTYLVSKIIVDVFLVQVQISGWYVVGPSTYSESVRRVRGTIAPALVNDSIAFYDNSPDILLKFTDSSQSIQRISMVYDCIKGELVLCANNYGGKYDPENSNIWNEHNVILEIYEIVWEQHKPGLPAAERPFSLVLAFFPASDPHLFGHIWAVGLKHGCSGPYIQGWGVADVSDVERDFNVWAGAESWVRSEDKWSSYRNIIGNPCPLSQGGFNPHLSKLLAENIVLRDGDTDRYKSKYGNPYRSVGSHSRGTVLGILGLSFGAVLVKLAYWVGDCPTPPRLFRAVEVVAYGVAGWLLVKGTLAILLGGWYL